MAYTFKKGGYQKRSGNSKTVKIRGFCSYAKVYDPDEYEGVYHWKISVHTDLDETLKVKEAGLTRLKFRDPNEQYSGVAGKFYTFKRPVEKTFQDKETGDYKTMYFAPPTIYGKDGKAIVEYTETEEGFERVGEPVLIGNGSEVEVGLSVFDAGKFGKGHRFNYVKILDLIEYNPNKKEEEVEPDGEEPPFDTDEDETPTKIIVKTPKQTAKKSTKKTEW